MTDGTSLGDRMKGYEEAVGTTLLRRTPVVIRVDGKAFHTLTRRITKEIDPSSEFHFSNKFHEVMMSTAGVMAHYIQNCVLAYTQSDEISFLLCDWQTHETQQWFSGKTQKIISVAAAMAAVNFNYFWNKTFDQPVEVAGYVTTDDEYEDRIKVNHPSNLALFDARVFNVPKEDIDNYFLWRQRDAMRNSVNFIARKYCSHKSLQGMNGQQIKQKLVDEHNVVWENYPLWEQRGACVLKHLKTFEEMLRSDLPSHIFDNDIPNFSEDRNYITKYLTVEQQ